MKKIEFIIKCFLLVCSLYPHILLTYFSTSPSNKFDFVFCSAFNIVLGKYAGLLGDVGVLRFAFYECFSQPWKSKYLPL